MAVEISGKKRAIGVINEYLTAADICDPKMRGQVVESSGIPLRFCCCVSWMPSARVYYRRPKN